MASVRSRTNTQEIPQLVIYLMAKVRFKIHMLA